MSDTASLDARARLLITRCGSLTKAARVSGIPRSTLACVAAGSVLRAGTAALVKERITATEHRLSSRA